MSEFFHDETITFTSDELTVISDVLRRIPDNLFAISLFTSKPEFKTAFLKLEQAKWNSFKEIEDE